MKIEEKIDTAAAKKSKVKSEILSIFKSSFFLAAAAVALVAATIAWFANNTTVTTEDMTVAAMEKTSFELKSANESEGKDVRDELSRYLDDSALHWLLTSNSNLNNYDDQPGIRPSSSGTLSFYVVPYFDSELIINCTLDMQPVMRDPNATDAEELRIAAEKLLRGHLLFACEYTCGDTTSHELVEVQNGAFQLRIPDAKADEERKIVLNWFWPYTLDDANNHVFFGKKISAMTKDQDYSAYFYYGKTGIVDVSSDFKVLNQGYNDADQLIGDKVEAVILKLTAELGS